MAAYGAQPSMPHYVGGGDLWEEPESPPPRMFLVEIARAIGAIGSTSAFVLFLDLVVGK